MLLAEPLVFGDLRGTMFTFEQAGDVLEKHNHTEDDVHITIVARGRVKVSSHDWERTVLPGQVVDFRPGEPHEITALDAGSRVFNIIKKMAAAR